MGYMMMIQNRITGIDDSYVMIRKKFANTFFKMNMGSMPEKWGFTPYMGGKTGMTGVSG